MDLPALVDFNLVAAHGGFGRASRASGRPKATLSRRVSELEESLGLRLVERGARTLRLTEAGAALHARTEGLLREIVEAGETVGAAVRQVRGPLRVSAPVLLAHLALGRVAAAFVAAHPEVRLEIVGEDRFVDLVEDGYDLVIRANPSPDERMVGRCILRDEQVLVAAPSVARPEMGDGAGDGAVRAVVLSASGPRAAWNIVDGEGRARTLAPNPVLRLSSLPMVRDAVLAGAGAALLPSSMTAADVAAGRLARWGVAEGPPAEIWALHASRRLVSARVSAFLACLAEAFPDGRLRLDDTSSPA